MVGERIWACISYVLHFLSMSSFDEYSSPQKPFLPSRPPPKHNHVSEKGPSFYPPGGRQSGPGSEFTCEYPQMVDWEPCSTPEDRSCWLRNKITGKEIGIHTNYEDVNETPIGIHREYKLDIANTTFNADGMNFNQAKLFNGSYPGPWIQACWGDNVSVIVTNSLEFNGTSVHWHGIRQWLTMHMDGVNGVTQCPIAPGDRFNYTWSALQYGSAWYHSHYSVQYADGSAGPLTLHGPTSAPYDEAKTPLLMTDWGHNSAFEALFTGLKHQTILLNGTGNITRTNNSEIATEPIPKPYTLHFDPTLVKSPNGPRPKRYLLRIINTSFDSTFIFSIDNHVLQVVGADFVPIESYTRRHIHVGIGQRYHIIVEANPVADVGTHLPEDGNYWIRTWKAECFGFNNSNPKTRWSSEYERTGILRYGDPDEEDDTLPTSVTTTPDFNCQDEPYDKLVPILPWDVKPPVNDPEGLVGQNFTVWGERGKGAPAIFPLARFSMAGASYGHDKFNPLRVDYNNPTFSNLDNDNGLWKPTWEVIEEEVDDGDWIYLVVKGHQGKQLGAHPIHLHGHDFAILQQKANATFPEGLDLKTDNPPRRDVVLLPTDGYVVIAFKADNPGAWLVHCHIATHAGMGLAMQILERRKAALAIWPNTTVSEALKENKRVCEKWNTWWGNCTNWWPGNGTMCKEGSDIASPDSGI